jgi:flavorubredoxin
VDTPNVTEIADGIYRLSTYVPAVAPPAGFTFNQFLIVGDEPLLFHTGPRRMFAGVRDAVAQIVPPDRLRWITFGHVEADECGSMNEWLAVAQRAQVAHGAIACSVQLADLADRPPQELANDQVIDLGRGKRVRYLDTPHTPHGWDAGVIYEESTKTLLCGDLFTQVGGGPALTSGDIVGPAIAAEDLFHYSALNPEMGTTIRRLATLSPRTLALMHGPSFNGDAVAALHALANDYDQRVARGTPATTPAAADLRVA